MFAPWPDLEFTVPTWGCGGGDADDAALWQRLRSIRAIIRTATADPESAAVVADGEATFQQIWEQLHERGVKRRETGLKFLMTATFGFFFLLCVPDLWRNWHSIPAWVLPMPILVLVALLLAIVGVWHFEWKVKIELPVPPLDAHVCALEPDGCTIHWINRWN